MIYLLYVYFGVFLLFAYLTKLLFRINGIKSGKVKIVPGAGPLDHGSGVEE